MERTMMHADNAYFLPVVEINGQVCRTHLPPNTAFRGFGGPQAVIVIENVMQEIAQRLGLDALDVRKRNLMAMETLRVTPRPTGKSSAITCCRKSSNNLKAPATIDHGGCDRSNSTRDS